MKLLFDCHFQNFHLCRHNGSPILQPNYFILQPNSLFLRFLFHVDGASEPAMLFPRRKGETRN